MKIGDKVSISPQVTDRTDWIDGVIIEIEKNPFAGIVITAKSDDGEVFFEKEDLFRFSGEEACTH
jgi:hypothetical protein